MSSSRFRLYIDKIRRAVSHSNSALFFQQCGQLFNEGMDKIVSAITSGSRLEHESKNKREDYSGIRLLLSPVYSYWSLILSVTVLTIFGLVMVFSSTSANLASLDESVYSSLLRQGLFAIMGVMGLIAVQFIPHKMFKNAVFVFFGFSLFLQALTLTPLGSSAGGNVGWLVFGPLRFQPAEILKVALCVWLPYAILDAHKHAMRMGATSRINRQKMTAYSIPLIGFCTAGGFVVAGKDLGTAIIIVIIAFTAFFISGVSLRWLLTSSIIGATLIILLFVRGNSNRWNRILATYGGCSSKDASMSLAICFQSLHGDYALATGGITGVGLGNSREKWSYLPAADNDYIFAVIGEELGFVGAVGVIIFIILLGWSIVNLSLRHQNIYMQISLMCFGAWFIFQSCINIAVVVGLLPVMGLPLPFISSGGSALVMGLTAAGICIRFARQQEDVRLSNSRT